MKVYYIKNDKPMIRIVRDSLPDYGFKIGTKFKIKVVKDKIILTVDKP